LVGTAPFWSDYLGDEVFGEPVSGLPADSYLDFPLSPNTSLRVGYYCRASKNEDFIQATDLRLRHTDNGQDTLLAWRQDDGHVHPHALRWEEADLIGRLQALNDPELLHPGIPFLLLLPYVASIEGSDHILGLQLLDSALRSLGIFSERQIRYRLSTFNRVPAESEWRRVPPYGWICHFLDKYSWQGGGKTIHSLRQPPADPSGNWPQFPFDEWNESMRYATETVASAEHRKEQVKQRSSSKTLPAIADHIELRYQLTRSDAAFATLPMIQRTLFENGLGICYLLGSWSAFENTEDPYSDLAHPNQADEYILSCYCDCPAVVELIRQIVTDAGNPEVRLYQLVDFEANPPYRRLL